MLDTTADQGPITPEWVERRRRALPGELLALVARLPGRTQSFYLHLPVAEGGPRGLGDDKYAAWQELITRGEIVEGENMGKNSRRPGWYTRGYIAVKPVINRVERGHKQLLHCVIKQPGMGPSHYTRISAKAGGALGSQERKEQWLRELEQAGKVELRPLLRPVGRRRVGVYPVETDTQL